MKKTHRMLLILCVTILSTAATWAQKSPTDSLSLSGRWLRCEQLTRTGQTKEAMALLDTLTVVARKEQKRDYILKAAFFRLLLEKQRTDEAPGFYIGFTDSLIRTAQDPVEKSILTVLKARAFIALYEQNRYQVNGRTAIVGGVADESKIDSWTKADYALKIHELYSAALAPEMLLKKTPNNQYEALLTPHQKSILRPTVFDLLVWDAMDFYRSSPLNADTEIPYTLNDPYLLASAADFVGHSFDSPDKSDSLNGDWLMLGYYQKLLQFHLKQQNNDQKNKLQKAALGDLDMARLEWAYNNSTDDLAAPNAGAKGEGLNKKALYQDALTQAIKAYTGTDAALSGASQLAATYIWSAETYKPSEGLGLEFHYDYLKALDVIKGFKSQLDQAIKKAGNTKNKNMLPPGAAGLLNFQKQITEPSLNIQLAAYHEPHKSTLALVEFRNLTKLYFRVLPRANKMEYTNFTDSVWNVLIKRKPLISFSQKLPETGDYQSHSAEIKIPALQKGAYCLLVSTDPAFTKSSILGAATINVTDLAFITHGGEQFFVNRTTGVPISGVKATLYERRWENGQFVYIPDTTLIADSKGMIRYEDPSYNQMMLATYQGDTITSAVNIYKPDQYADTEDESDSGEKEMLFYLDRSIYRPGQQLQFKGIATIKYPDQRGRKLLTENSAHKIYLVSAGQKLDSVTLRVNEFGSLSGVFNLAQGHKPGSYQLTADDMGGIAYFRVEQYKRPTYFVAIDTLKEAVKLGDSITVRGQAMAYSGYPITNAGVAIRVNRQVYFPYRWFGYLPPNRQSAVAHGTVKTDDKGHFQFTFLASAANKEELRFMPNYNFKIEASCTDQNGETRTANSLIVLGAQPFNILLNVAEQLPDNLLDTILLQTKTADGRFTPQAVTLSITALDPPSRLLRSRSWHTPDLSVMDSVDFVHDFPHDAYMNEAEKDHWKRGAVVFTKQLTTRPEGKVALHKNLQPGWYLVQAKAPGENGQVITDKRYVYLYNPKAPDITSFYNWLEKGSTSVLAGETTGLTLGSAVKNQTVIYSVTRMGKNGQDLKYGQVVLGEAPTRLPLTLTDADIYGARIDYSFVRDNRVYTGSMTASLKDTTTQPKIVYESYRDKTLPGSQEHWTLHIDKGGQRLKNMELLSGMYDASLDQFAPHYWSIPSMKGGGSLITSDWGNMAAFHQESLAIHHPSQLSYRSDESYNHLIFKDWLASNNRVVRMGRVMLRGVQLTGRAAGVAAPEALNDVVAVGYGTKKEKVQSLSAGVTIITEPDNTTHPVRTDFRETAFFFPAVHSDADGNYSIDFQMPDALTSWKWMNLAYDKDLHMVYSTKNVVTQKTLMVSPNMPRFVRSGDHLTLSTKVINLSQQDLETNVSIELQDPATGKPLHFLAAESGDKNDVNQKVGDSKIVMVKANSNIPVRFDLVVPEGFTGPVDITLKAEGGKYSDAEKNVLPVITSKMLLTETLPIYMDGDGKASFTMDKLLALKDNKGNNQKENKKLIFEMTTNPIWNVVMALPEVHPGKNPGGMEVIYQLYAEAMGNYIVNKYPEISRVIHSWSSDASLPENKNALLSQLEKNADLKSILLDETPWVMEAQNETQRHQALVRFFDKDKMDSTQRALVSQLLALQQPDGGFSWFSGGRSDVLSTQWVLSGINQLTGSKLKDVSLSLPLADIAQRASGYLNSYYQMRYAQWKEKIKADSIRLQANKGDLSKLDTIYPISAMEIHYLYALSLNSDPGNLDVVQQHFLQAEKQNWQQKSNYLQLMIAATQYRMGDQGFAVNTGLSAVLNRSILKAGIGRYWKESEDYYNWSSSALPAQALAISLLTEVGKSSQGYSTHPEWQAYLSELQRYLIGQKQVNHWPATRATIDACVAIIDATPGELTSDRKVNVQIGHLKPDLTKEAGTGYFRYEIAGKDITPDMGKVTLQLKGAGKNSPVPVYGGLYWQYISPIKAVEQAPKTTGITLEKALYKEVNTTSGKQLVALKSTDILQVGDKLVSRLIIHLDRGMDYLHLREMRAAGVQPDQNISGYAYQDGLSYYQAISDMTTDLYFDHISKGAYVIEYPVHVSHAGSFAAGTATIESFYAPSFATHTEGVSIKATQAN
ncbi:alpha-2-macroglobulin family protein [Arachidicoccus ginsenosidivorans]